MQEMNTFLRGKKILQVKEQLVGIHTDEACWTFSVRYVDDINAFERDKAKVDYREVLEPEAFQRFSAMRVIRKQVAKEGGVAPYMVFTDFELSELAKMEPLTLDSMLKVQGIGEKKIEKYGHFFVNSAAKEDNQYINDSAK